MNSEVELMKSKDIIKCVTTDSNSPDKFKIQMIPISQLESIETYGNIRISTPLLKLCNKVGIPCFFNTFMGRPIGKFVPEKQGSSITKLDQYKTYLCPEKRLHIAKQFVSKASKERIRMIQKFALERKEEKSIGKIKNYLKRIKTLKNLSELRGIEGNIMKTYFASFSKLLHNLNFNGRSQRPPQDEGNSVMSFGNVVLYNTIRAQVYKTSLDPLVGFLHEVHENRDSLALDIAEIFRPIIVDNLIFQLDHKHNLLPEHFIKDEMKCFLTQRGKIIWLKTYKDFLLSSIRYPPLKRSISVKEQIKLECYNLIKYLTGENQKYSPLEFQNA